MSALGSVRIKRSTTKARRHEGKATEKSIVKMPFGPGFVHYQKASLREALLRVFVSSWWIFSSRFFAPKHEVAA